MRHHYDPYRWHLIADKQVPNWVRHRFGWDCNKFPCGGYRDHSDECSYDGRHPTYAKGRHYEYKQIVIEADHAHDNTVMRRKLRHEGHKR